MTVVSTLQIVVKHAQKCAGCNPRLLRIFGADGTFEHFARLILGVDLGRIQPTDARPISTGRVSPQDKIDVIFYLFSNVISIPTHAVRAVVLATECTSVSSERSFVVGSEHIASRTRGMSAFHCLETVY